jgi:hypothetical protein
MNFITWLKERKKRERERINKSNESVDLFNKNNLERLKKEAEKGFHDRLLEEQRKEKEKAEEIKALKAELDSLMDVYIEYELNKAENGKRYSKAYKEVINDVNIPYGETPYYVDGKYWIVNKINSNSNTLRLTLLHDVYGEVPEKSTDKHLKKIKNLIRSYTYYFGKDINIANIVHKYFKYFDLNEIKYMETNNSISIVQTKYIIHRGYMFELKRTYYSKDEKPNTNISMVDNKANALTKKEKIDE